MPGHLEGSPPKKPVAFRGLTGWLSSSEEFSAGKNGMEVKRIWLRSEIGKFLALWKPPKRLFF